MREEIFGGLTCRITGGTDRHGGGTGPIVVLLHGFGASGSDLVPLGRVLDVPSAVRFVFPEAPIPLDMGYGAARAWWLIDMERIERAAHGDAVEVLASDHPEGMPEARALVRNMLDEVTSALGGGPLVLGGFSQGAMLSCDVALCDSRPLGALVLMSGALVARSAWAPLAGARRGLRVIQSHGTEDPLLPVASAMALRDLLRSGGLEVQWVQFRGGHTIPEGVLEKLGVLLTALAGQAAPCS